MVSVSASGRAGAAAGALLALLLLGAGAAPREGERLALDDPRLAQRLPAEVHAARSALALPGRGVGAGAASRRSR